MTQLERLEAVLRDGYPHRSDELVEKVYGKSCPLARLAARIWDLKKRLPAGAVVRSWRDKENPGLNWYRVVLPGQGTLFQAEA